LVELIREVGAAHGITGPSLSVGVTAFPAAHDNPQWRDQGIEVLKAKRDAGADFAVTQVFYDPAQYTRLIDDAGAAGIDLPVLPGIIPLVNVNRASRLEQLTGVPAPDTLVAALNHASSDDEAR